MNTQRKRSKSKGYRYKPDEVEQKRCRRTATKKNSRKKRRQARYTPPPDTELTKSAKAAQAVEAARKRFERWLASAAAQALAKRDPYYFPRWVEESLRELTETVP